MNSICRYCGAELDLTAPTACCSGYRAASIKRFRHTQPEVFLAIQRLEDTVIALQEEVKRRRGGRPRVKQEDVA
jgi:hypothetical protein